MPTRVCYHCKEEIEEGAPHDCWTTTEENLTRDLSEDLMDAWERLRETAADFGDQKVYASHKSIMFPRKACYFFVRPKKSLNATTSNASDTRTPRRAPSTSV